MTAAPSLARVWWETTRPKTLFAALAPVAVGATLAVQHGPLHLITLLLTLGAAVAVQIGTNFCNDVFDHRQGADTERRQGPRRGLQSGRISFPTMVAATVFCFGLVALFSVPLFLRGGIPVVWIALASIFSGIFYTAGRHSLAYTGMADLFVIVFFGPVAVAGTYYLQFPDAWPPPEVFIAGLGPGLIATALLTVNNLRDIDEDRSNDKRTLAVRFGRSFARAEYRVCMIAALFLPLLASIVAGRPRTETLANAAMLMLLPSVLGLMRRVGTGTTGPELNPVLGRTGLTLLRFALIFAITWPLDL
jgi:1,4-dihydroxy-2-naphthoate octaprenyltransferase